MNTGETLAFTVISFAFFFTLQVVGVVVVVVVLLILLLIIIIIVVVVVVVITAEGMRWASRRKVFSFGQCN